MLNRLDPESYSLDSFKPTMRKALSTEHFHRPNEYISRYAHDEKAEYQDRNIALGQAHSELGDLKYLPKDMIVSILGYLPVHDVVTNMSVLNKSWRRFLSDPYVSRPYILSNMKAMVMDTMESGYAMELGHYLLRSPTRESLLQYFQDAFPGLTSFGELRSRYNKINGIWKGVPPFDGEHGLSIRYSAYNDQTNLIEDLNRTSSCLMMTGRTWQDYVSAVDKLISTAEELSGYLTEKFGSPEFKPDRLRYFHEWQLFYQFRSDLALVGACVSEVLVLHDVFELLTSGNPNRQQMVIDCLSDTSKTREMTYGAWLAICNIQDSYLDRSMLVQNEGTLRHFDLLYPDELANALRISYSENFIRSVLNSEKLCGILNRDYLYRLTHCKKPSLFLESPYVIHQLDDSDIHTLMRLCSEEVVSQSPGILDINPGLLNRISDEMWFYLARECVTYAKWRGIYNFLSAENLSILIVDHHKHFLLNDRNVLVKISPLLSSRRYDPPQWFRRDAIRVIDKLQDVCRRKRPDFWQVVLPAPEPAPPRVPTYRELVRSAAEEALLRPDFDPGIFSADTLKWYCLLRLREHDGINVSDFIDVVSGNKFYMQSIDAGSAQKIITNSRMYANEMRLGVYYRRELRDSLELLIRTADEIFSSGTLEEKLNAASILMQTDIVVTRPDYVNSYRASAENIPGVPASREYQLRCAMLAVAGALLMAVAALGAAGTLGISTPVSAAMGAAGTVMLVSGMGLFAAGQRKGLSKAVHAVSDAIDEERMLAEQEPLLRGYQV